MSDPQFAGQIRELRLARGKDPAEPSSLARPFHPINPQTGSTSQSLKNAGQLDRNRGLSLAEQPPCKIHELKVTINSASLWIAAANPWRSSGSGRNNDGTK